MGVDIPLVFICTKGTLGESVKLNGQSTIFASNLKINVLITLFKLRFLSTDSFFSKKSLNLLLYLKAAVSGRGTIMPQFAWLEGAEVVKIKYDFLRFDH